MKSGSSKMPLSCWWLAACFWFTAPMAWSWGLQVHVPPPVPRAGPVKMPAEWVREGFPAFVDVSQPITDVRPWAKLQIGIRNRAAANRLVLPRDFEMTKFLLTQLPGRHEHFNTFVTLPGCFAGTAYEKPAIALLRPILRQPGLDPNIHALAAWGLAALNDKQSVFPMLALLPDMEGACATLTRRAIDKLGWVLPPEEINPE